MAKKKTKATADNKQFYQQWWFWVIIAVVVMGIIGAIISPQKEEDKSTPVSTTEETKTDSLEFLRKCTVMEAADIYTTGIGGSRATAFDDALKTCQSFEKTLSVEDFESSITEDWANRKDETIEGKPLSYYLENLGW